MPKKTSIEMQLVDIEEQLETLTDKINKLGRCYDDYMEQQSMVNVSIAVMLDKLTSQLDLSYEQETTGYDNPWSFRLVEEV